jgi:hypothetical protein
MSARRFKNAMRLIARFYDELPMKVHRKSDIERHLIENEATWSMGLDVGIEKFMKLMIESSQLTQV